MSESNVEWTTFSRGGTPLLDGDMAADDRALDPPMRHAKPAPLAVVRTFAFVDISGFTRFCDRHGEPAAIELLAAFRETVRTASARRGVRVAKWLGDGVMLVGLEAAPVIATVGEIVVRCDATDLHTHAGIASGEVLLFEGDDYVGRTVNLAARLGDAATRSEILVAGDPVALPPWLEVCARRQLGVPGVDTPVAVHQVAVSEAVRRNFPPRSAA